MATRQNNTSDLNAFGLGQTPQSQQTINKAILDLAKKVNTEYGKLVS
jgi:hypothetical protein